MDGGAGNDTMAGGAGNETYVVDSLGDTITEADGGHRYGFDDSCRLYVGGKS